MKVTIQVTQEDIVRGKPCDVYACPVGIAMARVLGRRFGLADLDGIEVDGLHVAIPTEVSIFMETLDYGGLVQPFQFTLDIPEPEPVEDAP